ncbi:MAG: spermidine/putrescine transporter ATPase subunit [Marmoricola sp.]|nr:spermidine/putrescine transporter ATPase subunit [Marmoricola sp.]
MDLTQTSGSAPTEPPAIQLIGVTKAYRSPEGIVPAVRGINLEIAQGEFFSLLGPSGCGKSTTLRMIAGFEQPDQGELRLMGRNMVGVPPNKRDINMVFQNYALFPHLTVYDNVAYGLRRQRVPRAEVKVRVGEALELMELGALGTRHSRGLSGGQQQRVALARALINRPRALLLDEPLGALDLKLRQTMQLELKRIQRDVGITFIYVTHDQSEALVMSDRIAVMDGGKIRQLGTPQDIYERPETRFVAGFVGSSNSVSGLVDRVVDGFGVLASDGDDRLLVPIRGDLVRAGESTLLTVRPEKLVLSTDPLGAADRECRMRGRVTEIVYLGTSTSYTVMTAAGATLTVHHHNASSAISSITGGDEVWICWRAADSHALASDTPTA